MRDDLKERLRKFAYSIPEKSSARFVYWAMLEMWSRDPDVDADTSTDWWPMNGNNTPWPDSRVEAFLDWAEQTEQSK